MNENKINDDSNSSESRPNSSRFPPITAHPKSATLRDRRIPLYSRSTSFDISSKRPKSSTGHNVVDNQLISSKRVNNSFPCLVMSESPAKIQNNFDYGSENLNSKMPLQNQIERKSNQLIKLKNEMTEIRPLSPFEDFADLIDNNEENERLRKENEILKQNFMKMTQIIRKYNQQISRKDRLILKLQQKYSFKQIEPSKDCLNSFGKSYYNLNSQQNSPNDQSFKYKTDHKVFNALEECLSEPLIRSEDSHSTIDQILEIFTTLINKMVLEFRTQLFKLNKTVEDKRRLIEKSLQVGYDSNFLDSQIPNDISSDEQTGSRLNELNNNYLELKESYQKLLNQSNSFKSYIDYLCNLYNIRRSEDLLSDANKVNHIYKNLVQSNQELNLQLNAVKQTLKNEEECIFNFIQITSEIELELELLGRNQKTLNHAITKLSSNFDSFSPTQDCLVCLKYLLLQLYKNQLKSSLLLPDCGSISANVSQNTHDQHYDHSHYKSNKIDNKITYQKKVVSQLQNRSNINSMEDWASYSLDKTLINDIDVESINYILINRSVNHNIDQYLQVVEEEEEEEANNQKETEPHETIERVHFQEFSAKNTLLKDSANNSCDGIEFIVEQVLYDLIFAVDQSLNEAKSKYSKKQNQQIDGQIVEIDQNITFSSGVQTENTTNHSFSSLDQINELPIVKVNAIALNNSRFDDEKLDSAFASEDNCSSPEASNNIDKCIDSIELNFQNKYTTLKDNNLKMEEKELIIKLLQLEAQEDLQTAQLSANGSILQLESLLTDNSDKNVQQINTDQKQKSSQHLNDQLNASKQLVQQQSHTMEKIRHQLEDMPSLVREKDKVIHAFKMCSSNTSNDLLKLQVQTQTIQANHFNSIESEVFNSSNCFDDEELGLNRLFNSLTNDQFEELNHFEDKKIDSINKKPENDVIDDCSDSFDCKKSAELIPLDSTESDNHSIRSNASSKSSYYAGNEINHKSDESEYSIQSESVSRSISEKTFAPFPTVHNLEERQGRHSCQGRVVSYGDHPRKPKLKLKNVEIVFNSKDNKQTKIH